jgi:simple sugar transport system ATP-binding protein
VRRPPAAPAAAAGLLDEPTLGMPVESAALVLARATEARAAGAAVLVATTNVQHAWAVADRFVLLYRGQILAVLGRAQTRREELYRAMFGAQDYQDLALQLQHAGVRGDAAAPPS